MKKDYRIGMRYIKTALAVTLCILIAKALRVEYPFFSAIAAIIAMESTVTAGFIAGRNRMLGTLVGAATGLLFVQLLPENALLSGIGVMFIIYVCTRMEWNNSIAIATIVFLAIMLNLQGHDPLLYSLNRIQDTLLGVTVALGVNVLVFPPDTGQQLIEGERRLNLQVREAVKALFCSGLPADLPALLEAIVALENQQQQHQAEFRLGRLREEEAVMAVAERLVIYRDLYAHMKMLMRLGGTPCLDSAGTARVNALFQAELPQGCRVEDDLNRVYNYHVSRILDHLESVG